MMKSEFIERTGFEPTLEEYREIEAEYMAAPEDVDKDTFCKQWKKRGGVERLMRLRARRIEELEAENESLRREMSERRQKANEESEGLRKQIRGLECEAKGQKRYAENEHRRAKELYDAMELRAIKAEEKLETIKKALAALQ